MGRAQGLLGAYQGHTEGQTATARGVDEPVAGQVIDNLKVVESQGTRAPTADELRSAISRIEVEAAEEAPNLKVVEFHGSRRPTATELRAALQRELVKGVAESLSERLMALEAVVTPLHSKGYDDERWNGRALLRLDVRPEYRELISIAEDDFDSENTIMRKVEELSGEALAWDETGYHEHQGPWGESHYLLDESQLEKVAAVIEELPALTEEDRKTYFEIFEVS